MHRSVLGTLILLVSGQVVAPAAAQEPVVEEQVALDTAGVVLRLDREMADRLGLYSDRREIREILLFRTPSGFVLELAFRRDGRIVRERRLLSGEEAEALRRDISQRLATFGPGRLLDRSGRYPFLATTTLFGLGFYGWAVPYVLDVDDARAAVALYMLVSSTSFFGPWLWSAENPVNGGMANAAFWGMSRGIVHGIAAHHVIAGPRPTFTQPCPPEDLDCWERRDAEQRAWGRWNIGSALLGSVGEGIGGLAWARSSRATPGDAHLAGILSDFGAAWLVGTALATGAEGNTRLLWGLTLAGAAGGFGGGIALANRRSPTWGDAEVARTAGLLGGYVGLTVADAVGADEVEPRSALAVAGSVGGFVLGDRLVRGADFSAGEAVLVDLGTIAGGLLGLGVAVLVTDDADTGATPHLIMSSIGAIAGFAGTYRSLVRGARAPGGDGAVEGLRFQLFPVPRPPGGGSALPPLGVRLRYVF